MGFRERMGIVEPRKVIQVDDLDAQTRLVLWNSAHRVMENLDGEWSYGEPDRVDIMLRFLWRNDLQKPNDEYPGRGTTVVNMVKARILDGDWSIALETIESLGMAFGVAFGVEEVPAEYQKLMNHRFEHFLVGYRFVAGELVRISTNTEVSEIETAVSGEGRHAIHLRRSLQLLANRDAPQYANVVHEAIHAVEAKIAALTDKHVLSDGLKALESAGYPIHPALAGGWTKLYGYTSDAGGIRHALVRDEEIDEPLALYFVVSCSAFVNFLSKVEAARG